MGEGGTGPFLDPDIIAQEVARRAKDDGLEEDLIAIDRRLRVVEEQRKRLAKAIASVADDEAVAPLLVELESLGVLGQGASAPSARKFSAGRYDDAATRQRLDGSVRLVPSGRRKPADADLSRQAHGLGSARRECPAYSRQTTNRAGRSRWHRCRSSPVIAVRLCSVE